MSEKRCRLRLTIKPGLAWYKDKMTEPKLQDYINQFLRRNRFKEEKEVVFQCSYECDAFDNSYEKTGTRFEQIVAGKKFVYTIDGFAQVNKANADFAHSRVLEILSEMKHEFLGVGGEALLYGTAGGFQNITFYTNSKGVYEDSLLNTADLAKTNDGTLAEFPRCVVSNLVDYENFDIIECKRPTVCVANVSRNGIRKTLCSKLDQLYIRDIIGVYCSDMYNRDLEFLKNYCIVSIKDNWNITIVHFKRIPIVSLGNNCSIAYQLQKKQLREARYPFDWIRYKKVDQLISCLESKFSDFTTIVSKKTPTGMFPIIEEDFPESDDKGVDVSKEILVNTYGMSFPHDKVEDLHKYEKRIDKLFGVFLVDYLIDCELTDEQMAKLKQLLPNARQIVRVENVPTVIHSPDTWKKDHMDWISIFKKLGC